jgi:hypothetical protein
MRKNALIELTEGSSFDIFTLVNGKLIKGTKFLNFVTWIVTGSQARPGFIS